ncbi:MAG: DUF1080 domain-containing protein [Acidobacteria bacterium]|nr:DUF1080 domain-containing protein [Acidobacteriota bacterium]
MTVAWVLLLAAVCQAQEAGWKPIFDGKSMDGWRPTPFKGHGKVAVEGGALMMHAGAPLTGLNYTGGLPKGRYEVRFEARKVLGGDFFASLTLPFGSAAFTWVTGGWGGDIVGISSIDGWDASDNETRTYFEFETGRWYAFRIAVSPERISAWIDDKQVINVAVAGRAVSMRPGAGELSAPFGFASYNTTGAIRKVEWRLWSK